MSQETHSGEGIGNSKRASKQFGANRVCAEEGCEVNLSRYNSGRFCAEHDNPRDRKNESGDGRQTPVEDRSSAAKWADVDRSIRRGRQSN